MEKYILFFSEALENKEFLSLLIENGKIVSVSENGTKTLVYWNNDNFDFIDNINILGPFSKEEGLSKLD